MLRIKITMKQPLFNILEHNLSAFLFSGFRNRALKNLLNL